MKYCKTKRQSILYKDIIFNISIISVTLFGWIGCITSQSTLVIYMYVTALRLEICINYGGWFVPSRVVAMSRCRQRDSATTRHRDNATSRQRDNATSRQRDIATTRHRDNAIARHRDNATTRHRDNATSRQRDNATSRQRDNNKDDPYRFRGPKVKVTGHG